MNRLLPFELEVPARTYLFTAYPAGILWRTPGFVETLCSYHLNFSMPRDNATRPDPGKILYAPKLEFWRWSRLGFIRHEPLLEQLERLPPEAAIDALHGRLNRGHYLWAKVDDFFLPPRPGFRTVHRAHEILVVGYHGDRCELAAATYTDAGEYVIAWINAGHFLDALRSPAIAAEAGLFAVEPLPRSGPQPIDRARIAAQARSFLESRDSEEDPRRRAPGRAHGREAYEEVKRYFSACLADGREADLRVVRFLMEHQQLMLLRTRLLLRQGGLALSPEAAARIQSRIPQVARSLHLTMVEHNHRSGRADPAAVGNQLDELRASDAGMAELFLQGV